MHEEQYLASLFEAARVENPKLSFEEVVQKFESTLPSGFGNWRNWGLGTSTLNVFLLILVGSVVYLGIYLLQTPPTALPLEGTWNSFLIQPKQVAHRPMDPTPAESFQRPARSVPRPISRREFPKNTSPAPKKNAVAQEDTLLVHENQRDTLLAQIEQIPTESRAPVQDLEETSTIIDSISKGIPRSAAPALPRRKEVQLRLFKKDDVAAIEHFVAKLKETGLQIDLKYDLEKAKQDIAAFALSFKHKKGLKFQVKGRGFFVFEILLQLDAQEQIESFRYRFNEEDFTWKVPLNCKGHKSYLFGQGYEGKSGTTNVRIE